MRNISYGELLENIGCGLVIFLEDDFTMPPTFKLNSVLYRSVRLNNEFLEKLYDAVKSKYLSGYNVRARFARYLYELRIVETFSDDELYSYLISVILKCGTGILSQEICSVVFGSDKIIPPKLISRGKYKAIFLDEHGIPAYAEFHDGQIVTKKISNKQFSL